MTINPARTERYAIVGFTLGALSILALLAAYCIVILRWPSGVEGEGVGVTLYLCAFPISLVGILLSGWGRFSPARRSLAVAGLLLSLAAALIVVAYFLLSMIELSQSHIF
jgi:hypothetical protein